MEAAVQGNRVRVSCKAHKALAQDDSGEVATEYLRDFLVRHLWCDYGKPSDRNLPFGNQDTPRGTPADVDGDLFACGHCGSFRGYMPDCPTHGNKVNE